MRVILLILGLMEDVDTANNEEMSFMWFRYLVPTSLGGFRY